jgi:hypothetical protein
MWRLCIYNETTIGIIKFFTRKEKMIYYKKHRCDYFGNFFVIDDMMYISERSYVNVYQINSTRTK